MTCSGKQEEEALTDANAKDGDSNQGRILVYLDKTVCLVVFIL